MNCKYEENNLGDITIKLLHSIGQRCVLLQQVLLQQRTESPSQANESAKPHTFQEKNPDLLLFGEEELVGGVGESMVERLDLIVEVGDEGVLVGEFGA